MTRLQRSVNRETARRADAGFTLIELLVVIVILGILAAVVVFAVTGVGDKGKASAVAIDARTIRTAEEAYCGKNGRYGSGQELVDGQFLSEFPKYHVVGAVNTGGVCNGWNYSILKTPQAGTYPQGSWQSISDPPFAGNFSVNDLHRLPDGRVLGLFFQFPNLLAAIWNPTTGTWTQLDSETERAPQTNDGAGAGHRSIVFRDDPATPESECGSNCGKVLVQVQGCSVPLNPACHAWWILDPNAQTGTQWQPIAFTVDSGFLTSASGITMRIPQFKVNCGDNCGKLLVTSLDNGSRGYAFYDPRVNGPAAFGVLFPFPPSVSPYFAHSYTLLPDGRVLLAGGANGNPAPAAFLLDPNTNTWTTDMTPPFQPANVRNNSPSHVLPTGQVLFSGSARALSAANTWRNLLYTPVANGPGIWTVLGSGCYITAPPPAAFGPPYCSVDSALPDGRVLARGTDSFTTRGTGGNGSAFAFDPVTQNWSLIAPPLNAAFFDTVTLDPRFGACGNYCGLVLAVGNQTAGSTQLYTP